MKHLTRLVCSLIVGAFMCTGASAHNPPPPEDDLVLLGTGETLQIAFVADCNVPQEDDAYIVDPGLREISFTFVVKGSTVGGSTGEYIDSISMLNGVVTVVDVPASTGQLLQLSIEDVSGQGVCRVSSIGRLVGSSGETRAQVRLIKNFMSRRADQIT